MKVLFVWNHFFLIDIMLRYVRSREQLDIDMTTFEMALYLP